MNWGDYWPQIILVSMWVMGIGVSAHKHGEYKPKEKYNFMLNLWVKIVWISLLYFGGFFI